jgi:hypothetical protein
MLSLACVFVRDGLSSIEMWFDHSENRCCDLSKVGMVETVRFHQVMWFFMLESTKDRILGVDTPGQHVPPRVWYGTTCLLVRYAIGCVSCSLEWGWLLSLWSVFVTFCVNCLNHMVQKGPLCAGNHCSASRAVCRETFVTECSDLYAMHQRKCNKSKEEVSLVA